MLNFELSVICSRMQEEFIILKFNIQNYLVYGRKI